MRGDAKEPNWLKIQWLTDDFEMLLASLKLRPEIQHEFLEAAYAELQQIYKMLLDENKNRINNTEV